MRARWLVTVLTVIGGVVVLSLIVSVAWLGVAMLIDADERGNAGWVLVGSVDHLERERVLYHDSARSYVVATDRGPIALYARSPHLGERVDYCASSGWFEERLHGSMFDGLGRYVLGPASRGMDRFTVHVVDGQVWVDTSNLLLGAPRGERDLEPAGPFCRT